MFGEDLVRDLFEKAAVLMRSLARNQPFVDGYKRTAWIAGLTMLEVNGVSIVATAPQAETLFAELAADCDYLKVAEFLRLHHVP
jgi:death-on-curing protein